MMTRKDQGQEMKDEMVRYLFTYICLTIHSTFLQSHLGVLTPDLLLWYNECVVCP